jgi:RNase P subunit RPR2
MALRDIILRFMPKPMKTEAEDESRHWVTTCPRCQQPFSVWDTGGVRYKATGGVRITLVRCPHCGKNSFVRFERKTDPPAKAQAVD